MEFSASFAVFLINPIKTCDSVAKGTHEIRQTRRPPNGIHSSAR
jgi:hypothetical protein